MYSAKNEIQMVTQTENSLACFSSSIVSHNQIIFLLNETIKKETGVFHQSL